MGLVTSVCRSVAAGSAVACRFPRSGLYAINREQDAGESLEQAVLRAVRGGLAAFQYRRKSHPADTASEREAAGLLAICHRHRVPLIVNDDVALAKRIGADGVHVGRHDLSPAEARAVLGQGAIIGVSCYDSVSLAQSAERAGADYVAFGRFFPSRTKPLATPARPDVLTEARRLLAVPIVAIGGINAENGGILLEAGAGLLAVVDAVFGAADPESAVRAFDRLFAGSGRSTKTVKR